MTARVWCWKCTMSFEVCKARGQTERGRCPECMKPWWWGKKTGNATSVGVQPEYAHMFESVPRLLKP